MHSLEVGGRTFRDIDSYNCARRDFAIIQRIREKIDYTNPESVKNVIDDINLNKYRFESLLGDDFLEELEEIASQLELEANNGKSSIRTNNNRNYGRANNIKDSDKINKKKIKQIKSDKNENKLPEVDEELKAEINRQIKISERKRKVSLALLALVALACISYLVFYYSMYLKNDIEYEKLSSMVKEETGKTEYSITLVEEDDTTPPILKKYETLYQKNNKIVGWLKIEGTNIDYPVMQTVNNEYYLDHNYNQEYDKNGSIFMDKDCNPAHPNDNMIIYGHHMKSGKMFGNLNLYSKEEYYKEHPLIIFDTIYEEGTYNVMYVFRSKIYSEEEIVFKYYKFIDATSENEFASNMDEMAKLSLYDTGVRANYGDKLITLSTCDYNEANGRFVIVAKKIK